MSSPTLKHGRRWTAFWVGAAAGVVLLILAAGQSIAPGAPRRASETRSSPPVFSDEFDGSQVDGAKWRSGYPWGCTNGTTGERQCYTKDAVQVRQGMLAITADRGGPDGFPYRSGMITSYGTFSQAYGYFEMRAKLPGGAGLWPAFWLLPEPAGTWPPELDVVELFGSDPNTALLAQHYRDDDGNPGRHGRSWTGPDFTAGFHTFAMSWSRDAIVWYVDGLERFRSDRDIPSEPMYVLVNLAVGGDAIGQPDPTTPFPSVMEVDYVRVWSTPAP